MHTMHTPTDYPARPAQQRAIDSLDTPLLLAVPDAARLLGIGTTFAWELVRSGDIPSVKLGRRVLVPRAALEHLARVHMPTNAQDRDEVSNISLPSVSTARRSRAPASRREGGKGRRTEQDRGAHGGQRLSDCSQWM